MFVANLYMEIFVCSMHIAMYNYSVGGVKLSVVRGYVLLQVCNWGRISVRYVFVIVAGVRYAGISNVLKSIE